MDGLNTFISLYGLPVVFIILLIKSSGLPIPVPADVIMVAAATQAAFGQLPLAAAFGTIVLALLVGGLLQFALAQRLGQIAAERYGRFMRISAERIAVSSQAMRSAGQTGNVGGMGLAILMPGLRSLTVIGCGVAQIPLRLFLPSLVVGSLGFTLLHFVIGFVLGPVLAAIIQALSPLGLVIALGVVLLLGLGVWIFIRARQRPDALPLEVVLDAIDAWQEAACPVCLTLAALNRFNPVAHDLTPAENRTR